MHATAETARQNVEYCARRVERSRAALADDLASGTRPEVIAVARELLAQAEQDFRYWSAYAANVHGVQAA